MKCLSLACLVVLVTAAAFAPASAKERTANPKLDSQRLATCTSWGITAAIIADEADRYGLSVAESAKGLYGQISPFMLQLATLAFELRAENLIDMDDRDGFLEMADFLRGVCYGAMPATKVKT